MPSEGSQADIVVLAGSIRTHNCLALVALSILYYDYLLTFSREIEHFWKGANLTLVAFLFVLNRYVGLVGNILVAIEYFFYLSPQRCRQLQTYHAYYTVASQVIVGLLLGLRVYVLYSRSRRVLTTLLILGAVSIAATLLGMRIKIPSEAPTLSLPPSLGCDLSVSKAWGLRTAVGWIAMVGIDTTIFVFTLVKAIRMAPLLHHRLFHILFRDGVIYYIAMVAVNSGNLITLVLPNIGDANRGLLTTFTNALSTTIASRILLNLRDPELKGGTFQIGRWSTDRSSQMVAIRPIVFTETSTQLAESNLSYHVTRSVESRESHLVV